MKKSYITKDQEEKIIEEARVADIFLRSNDFGFIREYINQSLSSLEEAIINDSFNDTTERVTLTQNVERDILISKEKQRNEAVGQRKWIIKFLKDIEYFVQLKGQMDMEIIKGNLRVKGGENVKDITEAKG